MYACALRLEDIESLVPCKTETGIGNPRYVKWSAIVPVVKRKATLDINQSLRTVSLKEVGLVNRGVVYSRAIALLAVAHTFSC